MSDLFSFSITISHTWCLRPLIGNPPKPDPPVQLMLGTAAAAAAGRLNKLTKCTYSFPECLLSKSLDSIDVAGIPALQQGWPPIASAQQRHPGAARREPWAYLHLKRQEASALVIYTKLGNNGAGGVGERKKNNERLAKPGFGAFARNPSGKRRKKEKKKCGMSLTPWERYARPSIVIILYVCLRKCYKGRFYSSVGTRKRRSGWAKC